MSGRRPEVTEVEDMNKKDYQEFGTLEIQQLDDVEGGLNLKDKKLRCRRCGTLISLETYRNQRGFCNNCYGK